jgi:nucleotide-binding universal stress UspA family protein
VRLLILRTVLVATDLEPSSLDALGSAHRLAKLAGAALHVVHVVAPASPGARGLASRGSPGDGVRAALRSADIPEGDVQLHVIPGSPAEAIGALADRVTADVIVIGHHRQQRGGTGGHSLGSTARRIAERAFAPVLVAGQPLRLPLHRVLVPTDFSDTARGALLVGLSWASGLRARAGEPTALTALHVQPDDEDAGRSGSSESLERELELLKRDAGSWADVTVQGCAKRDADAARAIGSFAVEHDADLVVVGTRGTGADDESRLGSVSDSVVTQVQVPTLLVPPAVWRVHAGVR